MIPLSVRLQQYIAMRRKLGFDMAFTERVLRKFIEFADRERADHITVDLFLRWKKHYGSANNCTQLHASPNTIASYRDTFCLLLKYTAKQLQREPTELQVADIDADLVGGFLTFVETSRSNVARSRNARYRRSARSSSISPAMSRSFCIIASRCSRCRPSDTRNGRSTFSPVPRSGSYRDS